jgi:dTMP kinase
MTAGFFLVLEGPEGAGKTTLAEALVARFRAAGVEPVTVREPGGTPVAEALRHALLERGGEWSAERELLYFVTARADVVTRVIRPALGAGKIVVSDRYELSTLAYQGAGRGLPAEMVAWVNRAATGGLRPDLTLIVDLPPELGEQRQQEGGKSRDRLDHEPIEFHRRVLERYRAERGPGVVHLDGALPRAELAAAAWAAVLDARPELLSAGVGGGR